MRRAIDDRPTVRQGLRLRRLVPVVIGLVALTLVCFSVPQVAEAVGDFFSALRGTFLENDSRANIVDNGFTATVPTDPQSSVVSDGYELKLRNYYLDAHEVGFDFTLSGADLDFVWEWVSLPNIALVTSNGSGERRVWESTDFAHEAAVKKIGDNEYSLAIVFSPQSPIDTGGKQIHLSFSDIQFFAPLDMEDDAPVLERSIAGPWNFDVRIDEKFAQADTITYHVVNPEAALEQGIVVESVEVRPSVSRIELAIDYAKNDLADKNEARETSVSGLKHKIDFMNTEISLKASGKVYGFGSSDIIREEGDIVYCYREVDSMYFEDADGVILQITSPHMEDGEVISIPLARD
jgi:hypothetical protein